MENNVKKKKKGIGLIILLIAVIVIVGLVATGIAGAREAMKNISAMNIKSYTVSKGTVRQTVSGSGQIEAADTDDVTAPVGVQVEKVLVSSGDEVTKGQKLAELKPESITDCLVEIESSLKSVSDELDADGKRKADDENKLTDLQIEQLNNETKDLKQAQSELNSLKNNPYITATTDGIIGDVNLTEGEKISQMSGSSSSSALSSLGTDASSYLSGAMGATSSTVVNGPASGSTADVVRIIPMGTADNSPAAITADGKGMAGGQGAPYAVLTADGDNDSTTGNGAAGNNSANSSAAGNNGSTTGSSAADNSVTNSSAAGNNGSTTDNGAADNSAAGNNGSTANSSSANSSSTNSGSTDSNSAANNSGTGNSGATDNGGSTAQQKVTSWDVLTSRMTAPAAGASPVTTEQLFADVNGTPFVDACHYTGTIGWIELPADSQQSGTSGTGAAGTASGSASSQGASGNAPAQGSSFAAFSAGKLYSAVITLTSADGYIFSSDSEPAASDFAGALTSQVRTEISSGGKIMTIMVPYVLAPDNTLNENQNALTEQEQQALQSLQSSVQSGLSGLSGLSGQNALSGLGGSDYSSLLNGLNGSSGYSLSGVDALSGAAGSASVSYNPYESTAFVIRKTDRMKVQVSIDEQDILLLSRGQKADVTLDAIEGKTFGGTVTEIGADAETGTGSAKYPVTIEIDGADEMKFGMSAEVTVQVGEAADVLVIPMEGLQQEGETMFVYTEEADDGTLGGRKTVETGLSDGENVEITSGLSDGDTIYYQKADDSNAFTSPFMDDGESSSSSES